jgi:type IV secretion system protein VirD4
MLPQELKQLAFEEEIILLSGENPIRCQKALYFKDKFFMDKLIALSPTLQQALSTRTLPSQEDLIMALSCGELAVSIADNVSEKRENALEKEQI